MRDIKRIEKFMYKLTELWRLYPDLRFWQLISIMEYPKDIDLFYLEENQWIDIIDNTIFEYKKRHSGTQNTEDK